MIEPWPAEATRLCRRVAANVRELRVAAGWSVELVARKVSAAGVPLPRQALVKLECGRRRKVSVDELYAFAGVFGLTVHELVVREPAAAGRR